MGTGGDNHTMNDDPAGMIPDGAPDPDAIDEALADYERRLRLYRQSGDKTGEARTLNSLGLTYHARGDLDKALAHYTASLTIRHEEKDGIGEAAVLYNIGLVHHARGELDQALAHYEKSLAAYQALSDRAGEAISHSRIGHVWRLRGDYVKALSHYQRSLEIRQRVGDRRGAALMLWNIGDVCERLECLDEAEGALDDALALYESMGLPEAAQLREALGLVRRRLAASGRGPESPK